MKSISLGSSLLAAAILVPALAATALADSRVVVLPFTPVTAKPERDAWISKAVQENVIQALNKMPALKAVPSIGKAPAVGDSAAAIRTAQSNKADLAVFGSYEIIGDQVRFTAQLIDASGRSYGAARTSGSVDNLLSLEDELAQQLTVASSNPTPALVGTGEEFFIGTSTTFFVNLADEYPTDSLAYTFDPSNYVFNPTEYSSNYSKSSYNYASNPSSYQPINNYVLNYQGGCPPHVSTVRASVQASVKSTAVASTAVTKATSYTFTNRGPGVSRVPIAAGAGKSR